MNFLKTFRVSGCALLVVSGVAGCGGKSPGSSNVTTPSPVLVNEIFTPSGAGPSLEICTVDLMSCSPSGPGPLTRVPGVLRVSPRGHVTLSHEGTTIWMGGNSSLAIRDDTAPIELQRGDVQINTSTQSMRVNAGGTLIEISGHSVAVIEATDTTKASITVRRGSAVGQGVKLAPGDSARLLTGAAPDSNAAWRGELAPVAMDLVLPPAPPDETRPPAPRGLGTLTARVPGTQDVIPGVRLVRHEVRATIQDGYAHTEIEEEFANDTDRVLEGRYVFPVPPEASLSRLALWVGNKLMEGEVVEKKRAATIFRSIVEDTVRPRDPALLEWVKGSEFSLKIFPIPAHGSRRVILGYDHAISIAGGEGRYVYPLSLGADRTTKIDTFSINVTLSDRAALDQVSVPGYTAAIAADGGAQKVTYNANAFEPHGDFVVRFARKISPEATTSWAAPRKEDPADSPGYLALRTTALAPSGQAIERRHAARSFVIDVSRSQSIETLAGQVKLVESMLQELDESERYTVLACDSGCRMFPSSATMQGTASIVEAKKWLASLTPSGSSDIAGALIAATRSLEAREVANEAAQVIFLSDGSPSSGELTVDSIAQHALPSLAKRKVDLRILGAGRTVDEIALRALATKLGATYDRVANGDSIEKRAIDLALSMRAPVITGPSIALPEGVTLAYPTSLPTLRLGQEIQIVARAASGVRGDVELKGTLDGAPYATKTPIAIVDTSRQNDLVPRLWAEARVRDLESQSGAVSPELLKLSQRFKVMSRATSFLTLESEAMYAEFGIARPSTPQVSTGDHSAMSRELEKLNIAQLGAPPTISSVLEGATPTGTLDTFSQNKGGVASGGGVGGLSGIGGPSGGGAPGDFQPGGSAAIRGPKPVVSGNGSVSSGKLNGAERQIAASRGRVRACYQQGLANDPSMAGRVSFNIRVSPDGSVTSVSVSPSGVSGAVATCIQSALHRISFNAPEGGPAVVTGSYTLRSVEQDGPPPNSPPFDPVGDRRWPAAPTPPPPNATHRAGTEAWRTDGEPTLEKLRKSAADAPAIRKHREALVRGLLLRGRFPDALKEAEAFSLSDPDNASAVELVAYAAAVNGDAKKAISAVDALVEGDPSNRAAHLRAAQALEASGDEIRACAHWRSAASLGSRSDDITAEAYRCRARALGERDIVLAELNAITSLGPKLKKLVEVMSGEIPKYDPGATPGAMEVQVTCDTEPCPSVAIVSPSGTIFSPWTPSAARSSANSVAVSSTGSGVYRTVLVGPVDRAGTVKIRAFGVEKVFAFAKDASPTIAETTITEPVWGGMMSAMLWGLPVDGCACILR